MKSCPFCAEEIQDAAIVCKHCGRDLVPSTVCASCGEDLPPGAARCPACHVGQITTPSPPAPAPTVVVQQLPAAPSAGIAALLSLVIPGAGQMYRGHVLRGLLWLVVVVIGYALFLVPGAILHLICIAAAASGIPAPVSVSASTVAGTAATSAPAIPPRASNRAERSIGRVLALLLNPAATWKTGSAGARLFLVGTYAVLAIYLIAVVVARR